MAVLLRGSRDKSGLVTLFAVISSLGIVNYDVLKSS